MFITRIALPRRTFLRGMGVTLGLPLLDAMVPALSAVADTPARPVRRVGFVYLPRSEEHTSELQSLTNLVCRLLLEKNNRPPRYGPACVGSCATPTDRTTGCAAARAS